MAEPILTFVHISDTHIPPKDMTQPVEPDPAVGAEQLIQRLNALPFTPDFVLHTGDVAYNKPNADFDLIAEMFEKVRYPVYYVAGNSDDPVMLQKTLLKSDTPIVPFHYEFEVKGVQIVIVDSNSGVGLQGGINDEQLTWLTKLCSAEDTRPLVIATHHNPKIGGSLWLDGDIAIQNTDAFHAAILPAKERLRGVFFGHIHQNIDVYRDGILYCSALSSWAQFHGWPGQATMEQDMEDGPGFSVVSVYSDQTVIRRHRFEPLK